MIVPPYGPVPCDVLLVGKAPGREECASDRPRPMIGRAGREQQAYLQRRSLSQWSFRLTNLCREYLEPDQPISREQLEYWTPDLLSEIERTRPRLIVPIGSAPVKWFLGMDADLKTVHGIPHRPGEFDPALRSRAPEGCCILPVIQPAAGFHSPDSRALIDWDFGELARVYSLVRSGREREIDYRTDPWQGRERYRDVTGREMRDIFLSELPSIIAVDTEGTPADPWSIQFCFREGEAYLLRCDQPDFREAMEAFEHCTRLGRNVVGHNIGMYDLEMIRAMGTSLFHAQVHDTLFDAYLFCLEPLGLKPLSWRWLGRRMKSHEETVGALGSQFQIEYLQRVVEHTRSWPKPSPCMRIENDGTWKIKKPNSLASRALDILRDWDKQKAREEFEEIIGGDEEGEDEEEGKEKGVHPQKRWRAVRKDLREEVKRLEAEIGPMPVGTMRRLAEHRFEDALQYSCDDVHSTFRLHPPFWARLVREGKTALAETYSQNMHVFSEMQENGMPVNRRKLLALRDRMTEEMLKLVAEISYKYNDGLPFNPKSPPQTLKLLDKWSLKGTKKTKAKKPSSGKKSIEHLKYTKDTMPEEEKFRRGLIVKLFEWRERQHIRDMFCKPTLDMTPEESEDNIVTARGQILPWGTPTRRSAMKRPNLLAQPKHSKLGKLLRDCYEAREGEVFIESDLAAIEVCVIAHESRDHQLVRILCTPGIKFHRVTGSGLFEVPYELVDDQQYKVGKTTIFLTFYGGTGQGLREQLWSQGLTQYDEERCQDFIDDVKYKVYPGIGRYEREVESHLRKYGRISDMGGMERYLPGIWSDDRGVAQEAVRHGVSQKIQGGAQTLLQNAISWLKGEVQNLREMGVEVKWRLTVHDSLLLTCPEWAVPMVQGVLEEGLTEHCGVKLRVPVRAESKTARTWGAL